MHVSTQFFRVLGLVTCLLAFNENHFSDYSYRVVYLNLRMRRRGGHNVSKKKKSP